jgi:hypothetical protein
MKSSRAGQGGEIVGGQGQGYFGQIHTTVACKLQRLQYGANKPGVAAAEVEQTDGVRALLLEHLCQFTV